METPAQKLTLRSSLVRNWLSLAGLIIAAGAWFAFFLLLTLDYFAKEESPYLGILTYMVAPAFMLLGAACILVGWMVQRRQAARALPGSAPTRFTIDISRPRDRKILISLAVASAFFLLITSIGSYQTYHVTKSSQFCGQACHTEMEPQYVAYQHSPHAQVECTACHVGPGAGSFVKSKFNGLHQVVVTLMDKVDKPIVAHGRTDISQKTCEQCHWPSRYVGNLDRTYQHFLDDETNTPYAVRLLLKVGGGDSTHGPLEGIHWHMNVANKVEYIATDELKQKIPWVRFTDTNGVATVFTTKDFKDDPAKHVIRTMDCMDCHSRPAHHFRAPNDAVDLAMALGKISTKLPAIKRESVLALTADYPSKEEALRKIESTLQAKYGNHPDLPGTISEVQQIFSRNFFPAMKTNWKLHPLP
jgi:hypothetical protein